MSSILIIIPVYNKESTIVRAVQSVLEQDENNFKLLIINDGSTDQSVDLLHQITDDRITVITQENKGVSNARNCGITYAQKNQFTHLTFLDADDYWLPQHLSQLKELQQEFPKVEVASSNYHIINEHGKTITTQFSNSTEASTFLLSEFFNHQLLNTTINSSNYLITTDSFKTIGLYNEDVTHGEDTEMIIKIGLQLTTAFHNNATVIIDKSAGNRSSRIQMHYRKLPDLAMYDQIESASFQRFLNLQRFAIAMDYKRAGNTKLSNQMIDEINVSNLSNQQQKLLRTPRIAIKILDAIKRTSQALGWNLRLR